MIWTKIIWINLDLLTLIFSSSLIQFGTSQLFLLAFLYFESQAPTETVDDQLKGLMHLLPAASGLCRIFLGLLSFTCPVSSLFKDTLHDMQRPFQLIALWNHLFGAKNIISCLSNAVIFFIHSTIFCDRLVITNCPQDTIYNWFLTKVSFMCRHKTGSSLELGALTFAQYCSYTFTWVFAHFSCSLLSQGVTTADRAACLIWHRF